MFKLQKNKFMTTTFVLIGIMAIAQVQAGSPDRKTLSGSACVSGGKPLSISGQGSVSALTHTTMVCPIVRDISRGRKVKVNVNLLHRNQLPSSIPDTQNYKREKTTCVVYGYDKTGSAPWGEFFTVEGLGRLTAEKTVYPPSHINSLVLTCRLGKGNILYSYSYMEWPR